MSIQIPQWMSEGLIPRLEIFKQQIIAALSQTNAAGQAEAGEIEDTEGDDITSTISGKSHSIFDGSDSSESSASTVPSDGVMAHLPAVAPGGGQVYTRKDLLDLLLFISKRVTLRRLKEIYVQVGIGPINFRRLEDLSLKACVETGTLHQFQEDHRCIRCDRQICSYCRHSILSKCTLFASSSTASLCDARRHNSLAAARISSTCSTQACINARPVSRYRCPCMEKLLSATTPQSVDIDGFYHCGECFEYSLTDLKVFNMAILQFQIARGLEVLAQYTCACGNAAVPENPRRCKLCLGVCLPYTVNAFDTFTTPSQMPRVVMQGLYTANGGREGQEEWNNSEVLWWIDNL